MLWKDDKSSRLATLGKIRRLPLLIRKQGRARLISSGGHDLTRVLPGDRGDPAEAAPELLRGGARARRRLRLRRAAFEQRTAG